MEHRELSAAVRDFVMDNDGAFPSINQLAEILEAGPGPSPYADSMLVRIHLCCKITCINGTLLPTAMCAKTHHPKFHSGYNT